MKKQYRNITLAIDIDDCVCNTFEMDKASGIYYANKNNISLTKEMLDTQNFFIPGVFNFTKEQELDFFIKEKQFIMKHNYMYPKVFVKEVISKLKKLGFKIIFITSRDNIFWNGNSKKYSKNWLKKYHIKYDKLYSNVKDKFELCKMLNVDYMIEDNPDFVEKLNNNNIKTILVKADYNKDYSNKLNIFVENWLDLYIKLGNLYKFDTNNIIFKD